MSKELVVGTKDPLSGLNGPRERRDDDQLRLQRSCKLVMKLTCLSFTNG